MDRGGTVAARPVELGPLVDGLRVVRKGIKPTDQVVIQGVQAAMPGGKVRPQRGRIAASAPAAAPATAG